MPAFETVIKIIEGASTTPPEVDQNSTPTCVKIAATDVVKVCAELHQHPETFFDMLSCVTGIDNGAEANTMEVIYNLYSIPFNFSVMLKVIIPRQDPNVDSVSGIWRTADWQEREVYDMFGITFNKHPDLRRILLPADWEGYPLRKDYQHQEYYRDVKVEY